LERDRREILHTAKFSDFPNIPKNELFSDL
jgi:hypothetical protein